MNFPLLKFFSFLGIGLLVSLFCGNVLAETQKETDVQKAITVSPVIYEINTIATEEEKFQGKITNNTESEIKVSIEFSNLNLERWVKDKKFILDKEEDPKRPAAWLSASETSIVISEGSFHEVDFTLNLPSDAEMSGYYPAIVYNAKIVDQTEEYLKITDQVIALIYLNIGEVKGETAQSSARISLFDVKKRIVFTPYAEFDLKFENIGNTFIHPRGKIHIYNRNRMHLSKTPTINDKFVHLLPGDSLEESIIWNPNYEFKLIPEFGKYTVVAEVLHNQDQKDISRAETYFYVVPIWHLLMLVGFIILVIGLYFGGKIIKRKYL